MPRENLMLTNKKTNNKYKTSNKKTKHVVNIYKFKIAHFSHSNLINLKQVLIL